MKTFGKKGVNQLEFRGDLEEYRRDLRKVAKYYQMILLIPLALFMGYFSVSVFLNLFGYYFQSCPSSLTDEEDPQTCQTFKSYLGRLDYNVRTASVDIGIWLVIQSVFTIQLLKDTRYHCGTRIRDVSLSTSAWLLIQLLYFVGELWDIGYNFLYNYDLRCTDLLFGFMDCHRVVVLNLYLAFMAPRIINIFVGTRFCWELNTQVKKRYRRRHQCYSVVVLKV